MLGTQQRQHGHRSLNCLLTWNNIRFL
jgi:hypothetical protein